MVVVVVAAVSSGIVTGSVNNGNVNGGTGCSWYQLVVSIGGSCIIVGSSSSISGI